MNTSLIYFFMGITLSMDAFFLSLSLGMNQIPYKMKKSFPIIVGLFHFIMPVLGNKIGTILSIYFIQQSNTLTGFLFFLLAIDMIRNNKEEKRVLTMTFPFLFITALSVSVDSLTVGIALGLKHQNIVLASIFFLLESMFFTKLGLSFGFQLQERFKKQATLVGAGILLLLSIRFFL